MSIAQVMGTRFARAITRQREFLNRAAMNDRESCQTVASTPVGIPRTVVIRLEYPSPETMMDAKVTRPPLGMFCAREKSTNSHVLGSVKHSRT